MRLLKLFGEFRQDLRFSLRQLSRSSMHAAMVILTFALGIAANAAIFSVMDALVLRPLAVPELDRIVTVTVRNNSQDPHAVSFGDFEDYRTQSHSFSSLAASTHRSMFLKAGGESDQIHVTLATSAIFPVYQVEPQFGRTFGSGEGQPGYDRQAVLSHRLWRERFGGKTGAVGQQIELDGRNYTILGVMPQSFDHVENTDVWLPLTLTPAERNDRSKRDYNVTARLRAGLSAGAAGAELSSIAALEAKRFPRTNEGWTVRVRPLVEVINGDLTPGFMRLVMAATLLLMLVVCANISNLQFARVARRAPEMAVRSALGSSRSRLVRQLLVESLVLSVLGAVAGMLLAKLALHAILVSMPYQMSRYLAGWDTLHLNARTLAYSMGIAMVAGLVSGVAPALAGMRVSLLAQIKGGGRGMSGSARSHRTRSIFAGAQVMLAIALVAAAASITAGMYSMVRDTARYAPGESLTWNISLPQSKYATATSQAAFVRDSLGSLQRLPGVRSAEFTTALPYNNTGTWWQVFDVQGDPVQPGQSRSTQRLTVSDGYFRALGLTLLAGRSLTTEDRPDSARVALVSKRFVEQYFGNRSPLGHTLHVGTGPDAIDVEVVGVIGDTIYTWVDQAPQAALYLSDGQFPTASGTFIVRTTGADPKVLEPAVQRVMSGIDPTVPLSELQTYDQFLHVSLIGIWYVVWMLGVDAAIALLLCALGIFGVMANLVMERRAEIGIRFAMGADRASVKRLMLRRSLMVIAIGLGAGLLVALELNRVLNSLLQGIQPFQGIVLSVSFFAVAIISLLAAYLPARRAAIIDPTLVLRAEY